MSFVAVLLLFFSMASFLFTCRRFLHSTSASSTPIRHKLDNAVTHFEKIIGLAEVKQAQNDVVLVSCSFYILRQLLALFVF